MDNKGTVPCPVCSLPMFGHYELEDGHHPGCRPLEKRKSDYVLCTRDQLLDRIIQLEDQVKLLDCKILYSEE